MTPLLLSSCTGCSLVKASLFAAPMTAAMEEFGIDTPVRQAAFLAQVGHESGGFVWMGEVWGPTAAQLLYEPPSAKATELGNRNPGDGKKFKGHGPIQITGRTNHRTCGKALGVDLETFPEKLTEPELGCRAAGWFWKTRNLNRYADSDDFRTLTRRINGGVTGIDDRMARWQAGRKALGLV